MTKTLKGINGNPLLKVNKHCMTDGEREYYRTEKGDWRPGRYDGKKFVWTSTTKYAARGIVARHPLDKRRKTKRKVRS